MSRSKLFRVIRLILVSISILFLTTCEKDPTGPTDNTPVTTATIGLDGGKLETEDFLLEVPAGSFSDNVTLNLSISTEESGFGESRVSEAFAIEGIPDEFEKPLRVAIKYTGELSDSSYIAVGKMSHDLTTGDSTIVYSFISIKDSSGFLIGSLNGNKGNGISKISKTTDDIVNPWTWFIGTTGKIEYKSDYFKFIYPNIYGLPTIQALDNQFDETLSKLMNDYNIQFPDWWWELKVILKDNNSHNSWSKDDKGYLFINADESLLTQLQNTNNQINISKVLLSLAMFANDDAIGKSTFAAHWLGASFYIFIPNNISIGDSHYPAELIGNELIPFSGLATQNSIASENIERSGGMQSLIKYLVKSEKITTTQLVDYICLYVDPFSECADNLIKNFLNAVPVFIADWWPDFFEKLMSR